MAKLTPPVNNYDHVRGPVEAPISLVEFGDYQCPHCGAAHPVVKQIQKNFWKKIKFVFRHFPLYNVHPYAMAAAIAAEAAGRQKKFWEMHDMIFENQELLSQQALLQFAMELGLDIALYRMDIADKVMTEKVEVDFDSGLRSGVNGTPSFFINGYKFNGGHNYTSLFEAIAHNSRAFH
jgi:protein-disulfide isomerase